jgi:hypothetical protein
MTTGLTLVNPPSVLDEVHTFLQAAAIFQENTSQLTSLTATQAALQQLEANRQAALRCASVTFGEDNGRIIVQAAADIIKTGSIDKLNDQILNPLRTKPGILGKVQQNTLLDRGLVRLGYKKADKLSKSEILEQSDLLAAALTGMFFDFGQFKAAAQQQDTKAVMAGTPMDYVIYPSVLAAKISDAWNIGTKRLRDIGVVATTERFENPPQNPQELFKFKSEITRALVGKATDLTNALRIMESESIDPEFRRNLIERAQRLGFKDIGDAIAGKTQNSNDSSAATTMTPALGTPTTPTPTAAPPGHSRSAR